jgi:hypothetical protein
MDSDANVLMVSRCHVPMLLDRQRKLLSDACSLGCARGMETQVKICIRPVINLVRQGGFIPDIVLWLSYFYTSRELPIRLRYGELDTGQHS